MDTRIRSAAGAVLFLSGLPAWAQDAAALKVAPANACASCPQTPGSVTPPGDPTMLIGAFIIGLIVGYLIARVLANRKR